MRTALVTDAGRGSAVAVIRSLGRRGWRVITSDVHATAAGRFSRHSRAFGRYPDPRTNPAGTVEAILDLVAREHVDLVFPVTDDVIVPMLDHRDAFEEVTRLALPSSAALRTAADKAAVTALASRCGVATPATIEWSGGATAPLVAIGWPVVVKPVRSRTLDDDGVVVAHDVTYAADPDALEARLATLTGPVLLQQYVTGEGHGVEVLARDGRVLAAFQHRRLREYPPSGGASSYREAADLDPRLLADATRLIAELGWTGLAMVEFKVGAGTHHLMEINGRVWGSMPLAVAAGVDFPAMAAAVHMGDEVEAAPAPPRAGPVRSRNVELELRWAAAVLTRHRLGSSPPPRRDALRVLARLFLPGDGYDVLDRRDPLPGIVDALHAVGSIVRLAGGR